MGDKAPRIGVEVTERSNPPRNTGAGFQSLVDQLFGIEVEEEEQEEAGEAQEDDSSGDNRR